MSGHNWPWWTYVEVVVKEIPHVWAVEHDAHVEARAPRVQRAEVCGNHRTQQHDATGGGCKVTNFFMVAEIAGKENLKRREWKVSITEVLQRGKGQVSFPLPPIEIRGWHPGSHRHGDNIQGGFLGSVSWKKQKRHGNWILSVSCEHCVVFWVPCYGTLFWRYLSGKRDSLFVSRGKVREDKGR